MYIFDVFIVLLKLEKWGSWNKTSFSSDFYCLNYNLKLSCACLWFYAVWRLKFCRVYFFFYYCQCQLVLLLFLLVLFFHLSKAFLDLLSPNLTQFYSMYHSALSVHQMNSCNLLLHDPKPEVNEPRSHIRATTLTLGEKPIKFS